MKNNCNVHLPRFGRTIPELQVPAPREKSPLAVKVFSVTEVFWLFVTVTVSGPLLPPLIEVDGKVSETGARETARLLPLRPYVWIATAELSVIVTAPVTVPGEGGVKVTLKVHLIPALRVPVHGVDPLGLAEKFPLVVSELIVKALALTLVTVTGTAALALPMTGFTILNDVGLNVSGTVDPPVPEPARVYICGLAVPPE